MTLSIGRVAAAVSCALMALCGVARPAAAPDHGAIAFAGSRALTEGEIVAAAAADFRRLLDDHDLQERQVDLQYAKARHDLLQTRLDARLDQLALEAEAAARGVSAETVRSELVVTPPTEEEVHAFYAENQDRIRQPYELVADKAREYLLDQRRQAASRSFYDTLRARHGIRSVLPPYRENVAASGPVRGARTAGITIVEFADFQCPYCREAESVLQKVLAQHPDDVRLVFRHLPLKELHPNAVAAAEAGICADQQGRFWEMHDAMYADQRALSAEALAATAERLGLQMDRYRSCLDASSTRRALDDDGAAARALGLNGTPYFFVNGRPLDGNVPLEKFEALIADELRLAKTGKAQAR